MKKVVFLFSFMLIAALNSFSQSNEEVLEEAINFKFIAGSSEWTIDQYVENSATVKNIDYSNSSSWVVVGSLKFTRIAKTYNATFTAVVTIYSDGSYKIKSLCSTDPTTNSSDCKYY